MGPALVMAALSIWAARGLLPETAAPEESIADLRCQPGATGSLLMLSREKSGPGEPSETCSNSLGYLLGRKIDINTAGIEDLKLLEGIGAKTAKKIILARDKLSGFKNHDDLEAVPGLSKKARSSLQKWVEIR